MKKLLLLLAAATALAAPLRAQDAAPQSPDGPPEVGQEEAGSGPVQDENGVWRFKTSYVLSHVKDIAGTTGISGFLQREAPDWVTQGYTRKDGVFVPGHEVKMLFGLPYGVGQFVMIFVCVLLMYLAIVKGFEPLLLLPIGDRKSVV